MTKDFWSFVVYDNQPARCCKPISSSRVWQPERSRCHQPRRSVDVWFGPEAPKGRETDWVPTVPGKSWNVLLRLYGPEQHGRQDLEAG